jgi:hypothetical protein
LGGEQILGASPLQQENSDKAVMQLVIDSVFQVRRDLDRSVAMAKEFLRVAPTTAPLPEGSYDLDQASRHLAITPRKLRELCKLRAIGHVRVDYRTFTFTRAELDLWQQKNKFKPKF